MNLTEISGNTASARVIIREKFFDKYVSEVSAMIQSRTEWLEALQKKDTMSMPEDQGKRTTYQINILAKEIHTLIGFVEYMTSLKDAYIAGTIEAFDGGCKEQARLENEVAWQYRMASIYKLGASCLKHRLQLQN